MAKTSPEDSSVAQPPDEDPRLGNRVHVFTAKGGAKANRASKLAREIVGAISLLMVPVGLGIVKGTAGTVLAIFGAILGLACYVAGNRKRPGRSTVIEVFARGIACSQGKDRRELLWNEVVDVTSDLIVSPSGAKSYAVAFEVVSQPPLLIVIGGAFGSDKAARALLDALETVWVPLWCRRAKALLSDQRPLTLGPAQLTCSCVRLGEAEWRWEDVRGLDSQPDCDALATESGPIRFDSNPVGPGPFPSAARRLAALAKSPPSPHPLASTK